jgi:hypothetical protein
LCYSIYIKNSLDYSNAIFLCLLNFYIKLTVRLTINNSKL